MVDWPRGHPADVSATAHVFVDRLDDAVELAHADGHHLQRVRRVREGESITAADGYGRWRAFVVDSVGSGTVHMVATSAIVHEPPLAPRLAVAFALTKAAKPELAVQKLTELGVDRIVVVNAARSVARWDATRAGAAMDRLQRVAREAGAQCRRARLPLIDGPVSSLELTDHAGLVIAAPGGGSPQDLPLPPDGEWLLAIGPEGGFDESELTAFTGAPRVSLGPFVLRAETAAIAAAAALNVRRVVLP